MQINRLYPPIGFNDTVTFERGVLKSLHPSVNVFKNHEIQEIHQGDVFLPETINGRRALFEVRRNELGKHVLQQQSTRGCTAGAVAMMLLDHQRKIDPEEMANSNLGMDNEMISQLETAGLHPIHSKPSASVNPFIWLQNEVKTKGSAIVTVDSDRMGAHVIIVDLVSDEGVRLRDPYHGWDITVTHEGFIKYWQPRSGIIQVTLALK
jgi:hypothetical protein